MYIAPEHPLTELIGELLLYFFDLPSFAIVPESPGHLLIGHCFAVALLETPLAGQNLFVFCGELEDALILVHPPDAVAHVAIPKQVQQELVQAHFLLVWMVKSAHVHETPEASRTGFQTKFTVLTGLFPERRELVTFILFFPI